MVFWWLCLVSSLAWVTSSSLLQVACSLNHKHVAAAIGTFCSTLVMGCQYVCVPRKKEPLFFSARDFKACASQAFYLVMVEASQGACKLKSLWCSLCQQHMMLLLLHVFKMFHFKIKIQAFPTQAVHLYHKKRYSSTPVPEQWLETTFFQQWLQYFIVTKTIGFLRKRLIFSKGVSLHHGCFYANIMLKRAQILCVHHTVSATCGLLSILAEG